jgi:hypothetical protein
VDGRRVTISSAVVKLAYLDPQIPRKFRFIPLHVGDETLGVFAAGADLRPAGTSVRVNRRYRVNEDDWRLAGDEQVDELASRLPPWTSRDERDLD